MCLESGDRKVYVLCDLFLEQCFIFTYALIFITRLKMNTALYELIKNWKTLLQPAYKF